MLGLGLVAAVNRLGGFSRFYLGILQYFRPGVAYYFEDA